VREGERLCFDTGQWLRGQTLESEAPCCSQRLVPMASRGFDRARLQPVARERPTARKQTREAVEGPDGRPPSASGMADGMLDSPGNA